MIQKYICPEHLREFIGKYSGVLVSDDDQPYHTLEKEKDDLVVADCHTHARRYFSNAITAMKQNTTDSEIKKTIAHQALKQSATIYKIEVDLKVLTAEERLERRNLSICHLK